MQISLGLSFITKTISICRNSKNMQKVIDRLNNTKL